MVTLVMTAIRLMSCMIGNHTPMSRVISGAGRLVMRNLWASNRISTMLVAKAVNAARGNRAQNMDTNLEHTL